MQRYVIELNQQRERLQRMSKIEEEKKENDKERYFKECRKQKGKKEVRDKERYFKNGENEEKKKERVMETVTMVDMNLFLSSYIAAKWGDKQI